MSRASTHKRSRFTDMKNTEVQTGPELLFFYTDATEIKEKLSHRKKCSSLGTGHISSIDLTNGTENHALNADWDLNLSCESSNSVEKTSSKKIVESGEAEFLQQINSLKNENSSLKEQKEILSSLIGILEERL